MLSEHCTLMLVPACQPPAWGRRSTAKRAVACHSRQADHGWLACMGSQNKEGDSVTPCFFSSWVCGGQLVDLCMATHSEPPKPHRWAHCSRSSACTLRAVANWRQWLWMRSALLCSSLDRCLRSRSARVLSKTCSLVSSPRDRPRKSILRWVGLPEKNIVITTYKNCWVSLVPTQLHASARH